MILCENHGILAEEGEFPEYLSKWEKMKEKGYSNSNIYVKKTKDKGLGVFAKNPINEGEEIEYCYAIKIPIEDSLKYLEKTHYIIEKYSYGGYVNYYILTGFGMIYNSANSKEESNITHITFHDKDIILFKAIKNIQKDEELLTWWTMPYFQKYCQKGGEINFIV